jgi:uncharacterized protein (TIGR03118 family)
MLLKTTLSILLLAGAAMAKDGSYVQHNLVSDLAGMADHTDANLVNAWGLVHGPATPWWVNANGTGLSILYDGAGNPVPAASPLAVNIPGPSGPGTPTGIVFNSTSDFQVDTNKPALFLFATEDGTLLGWNPQVSRPNAIVKVPASGGVYKGLAMGQTGGKNVLYVANFHAGTVDVFDGGWAPVSMPGAFRDRRIPAGYAPFNVQNINGYLFVTYAKQDADKHDDVAGPGKGFVDEFTMDGKLVMRLDHGPWLNSPWGLAIAPAGFGKLSGRLLVGNFGSGQIAAYNPWNGEFEGMMRGKRGKPITIDGLWGLSFGNDAASGPSTTLFFAAGIQDESHGLFGTLLPVNPQAKGGSDNDDDDRGGY